MTHCPTRCAAGLIRFLIAVVLMAGLIAVGVGAWANMDEDHDGDGKPDGLTFHVLDPAWWGVARDDLKPVLQEAKAKALSMREEIWADGGMVDQAEDFLASSEKGYQAAKDAGLIKGPAPQVGNRSQTKAQEARAESASADPAVAMAGAEGTMPAGVSVDGEADVLEPVQQNPIGDLGRAPTLHLEDNIADAGEYFAAGLVAYKLAKPVGEQLSTQGEGKLFEAQVHFRSVRALLIGTLDEYATRADHDPELLSFGRGMLERSNGLLLESM